MSTFLPAKHAILTTAFFRSKPVAKSVPAIFLDRDGTINVDHGYVHEIDKFEFIDGVIDAMRQLKRWATRWWW
jgi:D-glycero-D-manno-heptose 1,7-bisphosphate phosphatase